MLEETILTEKILAELQAFVRKLSKQDFKEIITGNSKLKITLENRNTRQTRKKSDSTKKQVISKSSITLDKAIQKLYNYSSRDEGFDFLDKNFTSRAELTLLAKRLDLPISKLDNIQRVRENIIETTIGFRLRSNVIQGK